MGGTIYSMLAEDSNVPQVMHDLVIPEHPQFTADITPVPDTPATGVEKESAQSEGPQPQEPGASLLDVSVEADVLKALDSALASALLPHEAQLANRKQQQGQQQQQVEGGAGKEGLDAGPAEPRAFSGAPTVLDYAAAYRSGAVTPTQVAERIIAFVAATQAAAGEGGRQRPGAPPVCWFVRGGWDPHEVRKQAEESTRRYQAGAPRSILEGVPYAVKDVADALPYPTTAGTSFLGAERPVTADAPYVAALRSAGAVLLGKTSSHEIGLGITGLNPVMGTALNPYTLRHHTGGSSAGTAAVLAAGLCPIAIGSDGGGSVRIPASFCGVVGLKPSVCRVGARGVVEVDCSVATVGPMAGCVQDVALLYAVMAHYGDRNGGADPQPVLPYINLPTAWPERPPSLAPSGGDWRPLAGIRIGVYDKWFDHASPAVVARCRAALGLLEGCGAAVVPVCVPELEHLRVAHTVTIVSEMMHNFRERYANPRLRGAFNRDVRMALATSKHWGPSDYLQAQRIRARANVHFRRVLGQVHVIATPTTPNPAPPIHPAALQGGESNLGQTSRVMRFMVAPNMLGLPALSLPVGCVPEEAEGSTSARSNAGGGGGRGAVQLLPVGLQLMGRPLCEATLLRVAAVLEAVIAAQRKAPPSGDGAAAASTSASSASGSAPPHVLPSVRLSPVTGESCGV